MNFPMLTPPPEKRLLGQLLQNLWTLCDDPSLTEEDTFHVLLDNGEIFSISTLKSVDVRMIEAGFPWRIPDLPEAIWLFTCERYQRGGITVDLEIAQELRRFTNHFFEGR